MGKVQSDTESKEAHEDSNDDEFVDDGMQSDDKILKLITECVPNAFKEDNVDRSSFSHLKE